MATQLSTVRDMPVARIATATLAVETSGVGFIEITAEVRRFLQAVGGREGTLLLFIRHTSASLTIQENADPDVRTDLVTALDRLAPADAGWVHDIEGPDDMPAHVKTMLTGTSLTIPVTAGGLTLGTWQGIYLAEHRAHAHRREIILQFLGNSA